MAIKFHAGSITKAILWEEQAILARADPER
jgi:hypothetical protein